MKRQVIIKESKRNLENRHLYLNRKNEDEEDLIKNTAYNDFDQIYKRYFEERLANDNVSRNTKAENMQRRQRKYLRCITGQTEM